MDYFIDTIALCVFLYVSYCLYFEYFRKGNKMSDEQLIEAYVTLKTKQRKKV